MKKLKTKLVYLIILSQLGLFFAPMVPVKAADFDPSFIVSNNDLEDYQSMNLNEIQTFLSSANSFMTNYMTTDIDGGTRFASEIIFNAANKNKINPKWILVTLQKEQSLVGSSTPSQDQLDWAMGYGVCDSCAKDDLGIQKFRGFANQIDKATSRLRYYLTFPEKFNFFAGQTFQIDNQAITIKNQATALLYNYTPHIHGNFNFWKLWSRWFAKAYPDGSLVQAEGEKGVWLIQNGLRRAINSKAVLKSLYGAQAVVSVSPSDLDNFSIGAQIKYPNHTLAKAENGDLFLLVNNEKRKITSKEAFRRLGYNPQEAEDLTVDELATYADGRDITAESSYDIGKLIQDSKSGGVYFVEQGFKYPIISKDIIKTNFPKEKIIKLKPAALEKFITGQKVKLNDGTLVRAKDSKTVFVISNGQRRPIANEKTFQQLGYDKKNVLVTSQSVLELHAIGDPIDIVVSNVSLTGQK